MRLISRHYPCRVDDIHNNTSHRQYPFGVAIVVKPLLVPYWIFFKTKDD